MKRMLIHIEESQYEALRRLAYEQNRTMSEIIREALDKHLGGFEMYVTNPWSGARVKITEVTQEQLDAMAQLMDDEVREQIHRELAPCTPTEFFQRYIELVGEDEAGKVWFS